MNLITANYCDFLTPDKNENVAYYNKFISQYTSIVTSTLVSQCNLMPEMFNEKESVLDESIDGFINAIPENAEEQRNRYRAMLMGAMLGVGELSQENEDRTFISENFKSQAKSAGISMRKLVIRTLNANAFLNYFFLIEETLRDTYLDVIPDTNKNLGGIKAISFCLKRKLNKIEKMNEFELELNKRSQFFKDFKSLCAMWELLNFIRNRQAHYNSAYDNNAKVRLSKLLDNFLIKNSSDDLLVVNNLFLNEMDEVVDFVNENGYLVFDDTLENLMRNTSLIIMESLYVIETKELS